MKQLIIWLLNYLNKKFEIRVVNEDLMYDIYDIWFFKERITIGITNRRIINFEEKEDKGGKNSYIRNNKNG